MGIPTFINDGPSWRRKIPSNGQNRLTHYCYFPKAVNNGQKEQWGLFGAPWRSKGSTQDVEDRAKARSASDTPDTLGYAFLQRVTQLLVLSSLTLADHA